MWHRYKFYHKLKTLWEMDKMLVTSIKCDFTTFQKHSSINYETLWLAYNLDFTMFQNHAFIRSEMVLDFSTSVQ